MKDDDPINELAISEMLSKMETPAYARSLEWLREHGFKAVISNNEIFHERKIQFIPPSIPSGLELKFTVCCANNMTSVTPCIPNVILVDMWPKAFNAIYQRYLKTGAGEPKYGAGYAIDRIQHRIEKWGIVVLDECDAEKAVRMSMHRLIDRIDSTIDEFSKYQEE